MISLRRVEGTDRDIARELLEGAKLPTDILGSTVGELWLARDGGSIALGGFEFYGEDALLRSVVVDGRHRRAGFGSLLVDKLLEMVRARGIVRVWLLTETADRFFERKGFRRTDRTEVRNPGLLSSAEFTHVCATTAVLMVRDL